MINLGVLQSITSGAYVQDERSVPPDLSAIIVSWNVRPLLVQCIIALSSPAVRDELHIEIIVVDNASTDESAKAVADCAGVRVIENARNVGFGRASNQAMRVAGGRYFLVLNPDTIPQPGSLRTLVDFADRHPDAGLVAPRLTNADGSVQEAAFHFPTLWMAALDLFPLPRIVPGRIRRRVQLSALNGRYLQEQSATKAFRIDHPLGACLLIRREAFQQAGGFNPKLFMYSEEIDLALRYRRSGWECWQVPAARVVHLGRQSTRQVPDRMFLELWRSRLAIYDMHYGMADRIGLRVLLSVAVARDLVKAMIQALFERRAGQTDFRSALRRARSLFGLLRGASVAR